ncbi:MAG: pseudouridine synthase [Methyloversatilis sp.]|nr:pseudouridine synthase [Methyloversatilis sp.]MDP3873084.1 pseudouridine synthase [Methyloversatilis sp.]
MLCGPQIVDFTMTTRPKLGLPSKSDSPTASDRDPARKPVRNSTAKSRTLSRNTTQVAPPAKTPRGRDAAPRRDMGDRPPRKDFSDRPPRSDRGERPARAPGAADAQKRPWTPRPERDSRPPRAEGGERAPRGNFADRPPRNDRGERPARAPGADDAPKRPWTPRPERDSRPPRAEGGERAPRGNFADRPPRTDRGERPARAPGADDAQKRPWTPRPERDSRPPRPEGGERAPRGNFADRPPRTDRGERPARAPGADDAQKRPWTPRPERDSRPPRAEGSERARSAKPAAAPLRPAKPWEERDMDKKGRVKAVPAEEGDDHPKDGIRVSRWLADRGAASRREADDWIVRGWVTVDGEVAVLGQRVLSHQKVEVNKEARADQALRVTVLMHKPVGFVSGQAEDGHEPASVLFVPENQWMGDKSGQTFNRNHLRGLAPAGRLDIDSHGLLVLTQDGRVARVLIGEDSTIEKEYLVRVRPAKSFGEGPLSETFPAESMALLNHGLELDDQPLKPAKVSWQNEEQMRFVLREGKKRQIRRMCDAVGLEVVALKRVRIGRIPLADLPVGKWRYLRNDEAF